MVNVLIIVSYWVEWHCDNFTEEYIHTIIGKFVIKRHELEGTDVS